MVNFNNDFGSATKRERKSMLTNISFELPISIFIGNDCFINFINNFRAVAVLVGWHF